MAIGIQDQYFGTEIEMTGITRQRAAEKVAELFGTRTVCDGGYYGVWSVTDQEGKKWKFMYDGSIYTERRERGRVVRAGSEYSTEMVSPKLSYGEMGKASGSGAVSQTSWGKGKCILRAACACGRFQSHPKKP